LAAAVLERARATSLGTPRAQSWDDAWLGFVDETEQRLGRRICGAHAPDGEPCELASTHPNGRCRFHGGHPRIGGQPGNTNAVIHGLYSRRLRQCNDTCPMWRMCPFAGADVMVLSERKRPVCAYEREAYAMAMRVPEMEQLGTAVRQSDATDEAHGTREANEAGDSRREGGGLPGFLSEPGKSPRESLITQLQHRATPFFGRRAATTKFPRDAAPAEAAVPSDPSASSAASAPLAAPSPPPDPAPAMIEDTGAILYAMLQRATLTVSAQQLTEQTEAASERYSFRTTKMSAALTAFLRIGRELRAWLKLRPAAPAAESSGEGPGFGDDKERPEFTEQGYQQFYDHKGNRIGLPRLMHPFLHELDAAVEQLRQEGITIAPPEAGM